MVAFRQLAQDQAEMFNKINRLLGEMRNISDQARKIAIAVAQNQFKLNVKVDQVTSMIQQILIQRE